MFSPLFFALYALAGLTDVLDGFIARKTGIVTAFGAKLDTASDAVFFGVMIIRLIGSAAVSVPFWCWTALIALIKIVNLICGIRLYGEFRTEHTPLNKITGILLFLLPFTEPVMDLNIGAAVICAAATLAALQENRLIRKGSPSGSMFSSSFQKG